MPLDFIHEYRPLVAEELKQLLVNDSFALLLQRRIGNELDGVLEAEPEGDPFDEEQDPRTAYLVTKLYLLVSTGWTLDHHWLENDDGSYTTDKGELLAPHIKPRISPVEHLAAYGLWQLYTNFYAVGLIPSEEEQWNDHGFSRPEALQYATQCVLVAFQALMYAHKILLGQALSPEQTERAARIANARKAADARHSLPGGSRQKRQTIREIWASGKYSSRDICAEQEAAALEMSLSTARKALIGTPDPRR